MAFCSKCGAELAPDAQFCSKCGAAVASVPATSADATGGYSIVLLTLGTCPQTQADDVLCDVLGYTELESFELLSTLPTQVACELTEQQAICLAQALTEYGMEVAAYYGNTPVEFGDKAVAPVYESDGNIVTSALGVLAALGIANRVAHFVRWTKPVPPRAHFVPRYTPVPPRHIRREVRPPKPHHVPPRPTPKPASFGRPAAPRPAGHAHHGGPATGHGPAAGRGHGTGHASSHGSRGSHGGPRGRH